LRPERKPPLNVRAVQRLMVRGQKLEFITYEKALEAFGSDRFTFNLVGVGQVQLSFVDPSQPRRRLLEKK
jgi:hypothetical protein